MTSVSRESLERHQVWIHLFAILVGLLIGSAMGDAAATLQAALWPLLGILLLATFSQVPLIHLRHAFRDARFIAAVLGGNFLAVPLIVWGLLWFLPNDPVIRLGVLLVLLMPCTDWFMSFTHLGGGDTSRAIAVTPINLLVQIVLLPVGLWVFMGESFLEIMSAGPILAAFITLVLLPLLGAWLLEIWSARGDRERRRVINRLGSAQVPLLACVVLLIAASQVESVLKALPVLGVVGGVFAAYLVATLGLGLLVARVFSFDAAAARTLTLSYGTRNSFVVLPLALALPSQWQAATVVIVFQSLVELFGVLMLLLVMPVLFRKAGD